MTFDVLGDLNWLAIVVATVLYFALGGLWYSVLFGRAWTKASGVTIPEGERPGPAIYLFPLLTSLVASIATGMLAGATATDTVGEGIVLGLVVGVGYAAAVTALGAVFDQKPQPGVWFAINAAYHVVGLLIVSVLVSVWT